ncbi:MAG: acetyl-CoA carboxylase biotin carboxylase subunit, partial [Bacteroidetes bacterium]|nr:acetyl-CoA carboxylase biotin carboxylase subunit [Bacteroidota bacterium]
ELESAFRGAQSEAKSAFSDDKVYIEKYLENPRHIEFQILADKYGNAVHLGERECSIQRRHQKIIEESPSVIITPQMREEMGRSATMAAISAKYVNAGTIEFLVDEHRKYYFLEMNTRLQVEHPVTEMRTGVDLVKEQIYIAMGESLRLKQNEIKFDGHALECRIYAEDSENNFLPSIGTITKLRSPQGFGIREDRGVDVGNQISVYYDPMISKLIAWAKTREDVINRMTLALNEYDLTGVKTNINLCKWIINHPKFVEGDFNTHFLNENYNFNEMKKKRTDIRKVLSAAVCLIHKYEKNEHSEIRTVSTNGLQSSKWKLKRYEHLKD